MLKKYFLISNLVFLLTMSVSVQSFATGLMSCDATPRESWKSKSELRTVLKEKGWTVRKIQVDGGCYEVYGTTPEKQRVEAYFDPISFEKLLVARRGKILFRKGE